MAAGEGVADVACRTDTYWVVADDGAESIGAAGTRTRVATLLAGAGQCQGTVAAH